MSEAPEITIDAAAAKEIRSAQGDGAPGPGRPSGRSARILKRLGWFSLGFFLLLSFTLVKLPREQLQAYIHGTLTSVLAEQGFGLIAGKRELSYFLGITYSMDDVKISTPTGTTIKAEEIEISPSLLRLLFGKLGATFQIKTAGNGTISGAFAAGKTSFSGSFKISSVDLKTSGLLEGLAQLSASGVVNGAGDLSGDLNNPANTDGKLSLELKKWVVDPQQIMGFNIPKLSVSEGTADIAISKGKAQVKTLNLGKAGNAADDIHASVSGEITLARQLEASMLNLQTKFRLSENVLKSFVLLDTLLSSGKQPDGSYGFKLTGMLGAPSSEPLAPAAK